MHFEIGGDSIEAVDGPRKWELLLLVSIITATVCTVFASAGACLRFLESHIMGEQLFSQGAAPLAICMKCFLGLFCLSCEEHKTYKMGRALTPLPEEPTKLWQITDKLIAQTSCNETYPQTHKHYLKIELQKKKDIMKKICSILLYLGSI